MQALCCECVQSCLWLSLWTEWTRRGCALAASFRSSQHSACRLSSFTNVRSLRKAQALREQCSMKAILEELMSSPLTCEKAEEPSY